MKTQKIIQKIKKLSEKYSSTGQDLYSYLDGLLYADYIGYWNYIRLDTLLSLQSPKTDFPDEKIFIIYHQITELYFQLSLLELEQINNNGRNVSETGEDLGWKKTLTAELFVEKMKRLNRYSINLINSFDIMIHGMHKEQFLKFRMSLLPSSGFQSVQYRMMEIQSTDLVNLIGATIIPKKTESNSMNKIFNNLYWKIGANELASGKKTYTLKQFEKKYQDRLIKLAKKMKSNNIWQKYKSLSLKDKKNKTLIKLLREYDRNININWKLAHYKSVVQYLKTSRANIIATGGTNWQEFLPPKFQKIIFFPELWSQTEKKNWGKTWVQSIIS